MAAGEASLPGWDALAGPILLTQPWRPSAQAAKATPEAGDGNTWAGRGFSRPGPEPEPEPEAGS
jgi:hypothetical protein